MYVCEAVPFVMGLSMKDLFGEVSSQGMLVVRDVFSFRVWGCFASVVVV